MTTKRHNLLTPFRDLLPPLSTEENDALRADIKANGVRVPVFEDEDGNILDGHHRLAIDPNAPRKTIRDLSPAEKEAFVFRCNFNRRNLSPEQKAEARRKMKATAAKLRDEDAKKWTNAAIGKAFGVSTDSVELWFRKLSTTNPNNRNRRKPPPDARVKLTPQQKEEAAKRVQAGESQATVAADNGVAQQTVSKIVKAEEKKQAAAAERATAAAAIKGNAGIIHGDFRAGKVEPESIQLIFTDPPYDKESASLYGDLAAFALHVLTPGGWLLAYAGHAHLPEVYAAMSVEGLVYGWTFCVLHSGGDLRFRKFKLQNGWKPVIAFYKPPLAASCDWFKDVVTGGKEKQDHEWQQALSEAAYFVEHLSTEEGIVCDPFAGSGTTLLAAKNLKRRWLGFETHEEHVQTARVKVS